MDTAPETFTSDQLSLTQWIQGFCKTILKQKPLTEKIHGWYLSNLMEDATYFAWQGAKAAYAVLLREWSRIPSNGKTWIILMEICRVHAQNHILSKSGWVKPSDHLGRKLWSCKNYLIGTCSYTCDHGFNGKPHKHICSFFWLGEAVGTSREIMYI